MKDQRNNHKLKRIGGACSRLLFGASVLALANRSASNAVNYVQAANADKVGVNVFEIDSRLTDIMWCGNTNEVILVQTQQGTIYRSRDKGDSWKKLHSMMHQSGQGVLDVGQTDIGQVQHMEQSPIDDNLVVFIGTNGINWVTEDCGANLRALNSGKKIHELQFHPTQRAWALAAGWTSCADFADDQPCEIYKELYYTKDLGSSWQYLKNYVFDFSWGSTRFSAENPRKNVETRVFLTHDPDLKGHQKTKERWNENVHLYYSDDFFKTEKIALDAGNSIIMTNHYMFVAKAVSAATVKIHVSRAEGAFLDFKTAILPQSYQFTDHFTVLDTNEKAVFLYVSDHKKMQPVGNLFVSDGMGYRFTHSLENIIKQFHNVDFEAVESMEGTFLANRYDTRHRTGSFNTEGTLQKLDIEDMRAIEEAKGEQTRMQNSGSMNRKQMETSEEGYKEELDEYMDKIKSYITHDKGANWFLLKPPEFYMDGTKTECFFENEECSLHIQMYSHKADSYAPPYSSEQAIGIVLATGNLGPNVQFDDNERKSTFLSRDGGLNWQEIAKTALIYDLGDQGGLIVAAPNTLSTKEVRYSWDEGKTWTKLRVSDSPIFIQNIIAEPKCTSQQFVIYGAYDNSTEEEEGGEFDVERKYGEALMITLDFAQLHEKKCTGHDRPGKDESDFELWSPHDDERHHLAQDGCLLGKKMTYVRRKQDTECFNDFQVNAETKWVKHYRSSIACTCTANDYECDMNYVRNAGGACEHVADPTGKITDWEKYDREKDCENEGFYYKNQGYRKIPGDECHNGVQYDQKKHVCGAFSGLTEGVSHFNWTKILIGTLAAGALYYGWPIIEAIFIILPIPDPSGAFGKLTGFFSGIFESIMNAIPGSYAVLGLIQTVLSPFTDLLPNRGGFGNSSSNNDSSGFEMGPGYSSNLEAQPEAFMEDDDSDDDIGKQKDEIDLNYDSDEKEDDDIGVTNSNDGATELISLDHDSSDSGPAKNIPKLQGPK